MSKRVAWVPLLLLTMTSQFGFAAHPSGTHRQLVREFYTSAHGLSADAIRAVAVTRTGLVLVVAGDVLLRQEDNRWVRERGPSRVTALSADSGQLDALVGTPAGVWALAQGRWQKEEASPQHVIAFASEPGGACWALSADGVWRRSDGWKRAHTLSPKISGPSSILPMGPDDVLVGSQSGLFGLMGKRKYWLSYEVSPGRLSSGDVRALARLGGSHFLVATDRGLNVTNGTTGWYSYTGANGLPILDLTSAACSADGTVWLGSKSGLVRLQAGRFTYLAGSRWLPDNRVTALAPAADGSVWVGTLKGLVSLRYRTMTLEEKANVYQATISNRERRHGFVTEMQLPAAGVLKGATQEISDNDGLWTSLYVAAQAFRYGATKSPAARAEAWRSMQALLRLESITGIAGFPARAIININEPAFAARSVRTQPEWRLSPVEPGWYWKGDTSSDELVGHYFAWYVFCALAADDAQKTRVRATCKRVTDHLLEHGYYLVDLDGKPTTWGVWAPQKLNDDPKWWADRGLNSLEVLSHLRVAMHLVGEPRYECAYEELIRKHHYALNTIEAKVTDGVSHDDQLLFLAYYPLLPLERDPALRAIYTASLRRTWDLERVEANPLWNFIYGACTGEPCDVEASLGSLRELPLDLVTWRVQNSQRSDLRFDPLLEQRGIKRPLRPLPWTERAIHKWDADPFLLNGGNDLGEGDPTIWLLPYWLGRYHRLIE